VKVKVRTAPPQLQQHNKPPPQIKASISTITRQSPTTRSSPEDPRLSDQDQPWPLSSTLCKYPGSEMRWQLRVTPSLHIHITRISRHTPNFRAHFAVPTPKALSLFGNIGISMATPTQTRVIVYPSPLQSACSRGTLFALHLRSPPQLQPIMPHAAHIPVIDAVSPVCPLPLFFLHETLAALA
jgi:hypothetical protein